MQICSTGEAETLYNAYMRQSCTAYAITKPLQIPLMRCDHRCRCELPQDQAEPPLQAKALHVLNLPVLPRHLYLRLALLILSISFSLIDLAYPTLACLTLVC